MRIIASSPAKLISEAELRAAALTWLQSDTPSASRRVYEELPVERGAARIDLAVVSTDLHGVELKSDFDSYARMHNQIHAYNRVFDRITLVTGDKLVDSALKLMPKWWGITIANRLSDSGIVLNNVRPAGVNPNQDAYSLAALLWSEEAKAILTASQTPFPKRASRAELYDLIANSTPLDEVRQFVTQRLLSRDLIASTP